jgi:hypothetical protein
MGKKSSPSAPPPIDQGKAQGEFLFGYGSGGFTGYQGITDPRLQQKLLESEGRYRPQYSALELADINTMWEGYEDVSTSPQYQSLQAELAGLEAGAAVSNLSTEERRAALGEQYDLSRANLSETGKASFGMLDLMGRTSNNRSSGRNRRSGKKGKQGDDGGDSREAYINAGMVGTNDRDARKAEIKTRMGEMEKMGGVKGYKSLLAEASRESGKLEREMLGLQRADDISALEKYAPQVVEAYRAADPYSTGLADKATERAKLQAASAAEKRLQKLGMNLSGKSLQKASAAEQQLQAMGMSLSDLSPTEQEALISQRGMEFAASTGQLTALEQRNAQQSARQASTARGRGMDQSALYGEMQSRMAEEMNKQEREINMGSQLLGQQAGLRGSRLGQGAGMLTNSEALAAQRRLEQLQRQQSGANMLTGSEALAGQRRAEYGQNLQQAFGMNRLIAGDLGSTILGRPSSAIGLGQSGIGQSIGLAAQPVGPQLFDPNMGSNLAMQQQANEVNYAGAMAQADASRSSGLMGAVGSIAGGYAASAAGSAFI